MNKEQNNIKERMQYDPIFREYVESGDSLKAAKLSTMAYLAISVGNAYNEQAIDILQKYNFVQKKLKTRINNLSQSFDSYNLEVSPLVNGEEARKLLLEDYDAFSEMCELFMNASKRIRPKDEWASDELRSPGMYLCRMADVKYTDILLLKWDGIGWLQWSPMTVPPYETWITIKKHKVERVVEHIYDSDYLKEENE